MNPNARGAAGASSRERYRRKAPPRQEVPTDLDWDAFRERYFPGRRPRHDFQAVRAYGAYKQDLRELPKGLAPEITTENGTTPDGVSLEQAAANTWESEGGAQPRGVGTEAAVHRRPLREAILVASGTVKSFNQSSGHGFIVPDEGGKDLWVHERNVIGDHATLREGERVEFGTREAGMGAEAIDVRPLISFETSRVEHTR